MDVAIVGAGIVGLAHAYLAARSGLQVQVFERNPAACGASLRNFGMIWPIGQPPGALHEQALRSREIWLELLKEAGFPCFETGSLHAAYREDEAAVGQEFAGRAPALGYECQWLDPRRTLLHSSALREEGLLGALWSSAEMTVDPRLIVRRLPLFLSERYGVQFVFGAAVTEAGAGRLKAAGKTWHAGTVILATGDDFQTLFPDYFRQSGMTRCKLQMLRTVPQPAGWELGPSLAFGLSFTHYPTFQICQSLQALRGRIAAESPDLVKWAIHVMVSQTARGELTLGDSHEYSLEVDIFDKTELNRLILDLATRYLRAPTLDIAETWHGVYAKHPDKPYSIFAPDPQTRVVTVTSGIGMTLSFGIAEQVLSEIGVAA